MGQVKDRHRQHHNKYAHLAAAARKRNEEEARARETRAKLPPPLFMERPQPFAAVPGTQDTIDIFYFNDLHRQLDPVALTCTGGVARLATVLDEARAQSGRSRVTVNLGDVSYDDGPQQGSKAFEPIPQLFRALGVDILTLGNHEFQDPTNDYATLQKGLLSRFSGDVLCANVTRASDNRPVPNTKPYTMRQLAGLNVAFIGLVTQDMATRSHPAVGAGLHVANLADTLKQLVPKVRSEGADAVVVLAHESFHDCVDIAKQVGGIDLLLAAHDHKVVPTPQQVAGPDGWVTPVSEAGSHARWLGHARLVVDPSKKRVLRVDGRLLPVDLKVTPNREVQDIARRYQEL